MIGHVPPRRALVSDPDPVRAARDWATNAEMIAEVARLGYLDGTVLDVTWGNGAWWDDWVPERLVGTDADQAKARDAAADFRALPFPDRSFDAVVFDPAYVAPGGRKTSTIGQFNDAYGLLSTPPNPEENQAKMNEGLAECVRVSRGLVLMKCQNYVWSGRLFLGVVESIRAGEELGCRVEDWFTMVGEPGIQPKGRTRKDGKPVLQQHARTNGSTLLVFRVPRRARRVGAGAEERSLFDEPRTVECAPGFGNVDGELVRLREAASVWFVEKHVEPLDSEETDDGR